MDFNPAPYRAPGTASTAKKKIFGLPVERSGKPWLALKPGETTAQWHVRLSRTCYQCGTYIVDKVALDAHEATHGGTDSGQAEEEVMPQD